jgi:hypothetical protein
MKIVIYVLMFLNILLAAETSDSGDTLICEVLGEGSKRIQCTFFTQRVPYDRNITFEWKSPSIGKDHRERTMILNAHHGSIYDYRYYYGRAPGEWRVCTKESGKKLVETRFVIQEQDEEEY